MLCTVLRRPSRLSLQRQSELRVQAGEEAKRKRRKEQYIKQLLQQEQLQQRLVKEHAAEEASRKEREFLRLHGDVLEGTQ